MLREVNKGGLKMAKIHRYHNGERWVGGMAAFVHDVSEAGGIDAYERKIAHDALDRLLDAGAIEVVRPKLRVVNGGKE